MLLLVVRDLLILSLIFTRSICMISYAIMWMACYMLCAYWMVLISVVDDMIENMGGNSTASVFKAHDDFMSTLYAPYDAKLIEEIWAKFNQAM